MKTIIKKAIFDKKEKKVGECILFYYSQINEIIKGKDDPNEYLIKISDELLDTEYVKITSQTEGDSYTIFEILNARGQILSDQELLKNYIMRYILPQDKVDEVKERWASLESLLDKYIDKFFKHYSTHKYLNDNKLSVYRTIKENSEKDKIANLFDDILLKAKYYSSMINPINTGDNKNCSDNEFYIFSFLKSKRAEQYRPIIMSLMHAKDKDLLTEKKYNEVILFMYHFFVCYNIIGEEKSNKLEDSVYKYAEILENAFSIENLNSFIKSLKDKLPTYDNFKNSVKTIGWSNHHKFYDDTKAKRRVYTILELLEMNKSNKSLIDNFTIEHVNPDSDGLNNVFIGNLLPLEDSLNKNAKDKNMIDKMEFYKRSNYRITRDFAERYANGNFDIDTRTLCIAKTLYYDILNLDPIE